MRNKASDPARKGQHARQAVPARVSLFPLGVARKKRDPGNRMPRPQPGSFVAFRLHSKYHGQTGRVERWSADRVFVITASNGAVAVPPKDVLLLPPPQMPVDPRTTTQIRDAESVIIEQVGVITLQLLDLHKRLADLRTSPMSSHSTITAMAEGAVSRCESPHPPLEPIMERSMPNMSCHQDTDTGAPWCPAADAPPAPVLQGNKRRRCGCCSEP